MPETPLLAPVGTSITAGTVDTGVVPEVGLWYRFVIEVADVGGETQIRAKVWDERFDAPLAFQIDAVDDSATRLTAGTFGIWSFDVGSKYWDDLLIESLALDPAQAVPLLDGPRLVWLIAALVGFGVIALRAPCSSMKLGG